MSETVVVVEWFYRFLLYYAIAATFMFAFSLFGIPFAIKWIKKKLWARKEYVRANFTTRAGTFEEVITKPDETGHINHKGRKYPFRKEKCLVDKDGMLVAHFDEESTEQLDLKNKASKDAPDPKHHSGVVEYAYLLGEMRAGKFLDNNLALLLLLAAVGVAAIAALLAYYNYTMIEQMMKTLASLSKQVASLKQAAGGAGVIK
jgi:hypothetical protein